MNPPLRALQRLLAGAISLTLIPAPSYLFAAETAELPLSGAAYLIADQAYKAYERQDYAEAVTKAREALRLRPDVARLQHLLNLSIAARDGRPQSTLKSSRAVAEKSKPVHRSTRPAGDVWVNTKDAPIDSGYAAADEAYKAYDRGAYDSAVRAAAEAVRLIPTNSAYRVLLINALLANQQEVEAEQALKEAIDQLGDDGKLHIERRHEASFSLSSNPAIGNGRAVLAYLTRSGDSSSTAASSRRCDCGRRAGRAEGGKN